MQILLTFARSRIGKLFIGWIFEHMSFAIPVNRLVETQTLMAFHHPRPSYPLHVLLVPKKAIGSLADLTLEDQSFLMDVFLTTQKLVREFNVVESGYRLIVNGGAYQDVPQLHFHLISERAAT